MFRNLRVAFCISGHLRCKYTGVVTIQWAMIPDSVETHYGDLPMDDSDSAQQAMPYGYSWWPCLEGHLSLEGPDKELVECVLDAAKTSNAVFLSCIYQLCDAGPVQTWPAQCNNRAKGEGSLMWGALDEVQGDRAKLDQGVWRDPSAAPSRK